MKITKNRIREIVKETLDKKLVEQEQEQEPEQTSSTGREMDRQMDKAVGLDKAIAQITTAPKYATELKKAIKRLSQNMDPSTAKSVLRKVVTDILK
tara:strand:+ start:751 stop:1038 length:288 start_codon:yes stop_codon:yes gene_type:complete